MPHGFPIAKRSQSRPNGSLLLLACFVEGDERAGAPAFFFAGFGSAFGAVATVGSDCRCDVI
jgi:hypothetical protein